MMPVSGQSTEELEQNYVPMSANSPSHHHSGSLSELVHEANYVPMTPSTMEFSSLGKQVPPPAHMGFRSSPKTPPRRPILSDCQPPPVDRNLKPDRKGEWWNGVHACADAFNSLWKPSVCVWFINRTSSNDPLLFNVLTHRYKLPSFQAFMSAFIFIMLHSFISSLLSHAALCSYCGLNSRLFLSDLWTSPGGYILLYQRL